MTILLILVSGSLVMAVINRVLRAMEAAGDFDPQSPSSAARPGLRVLFDFGDRGWGTDGINQRPAPRELMHRD